jgi:hypothetical protein
MHESVFVLFISSVLNRRERLIIGISVDSSARQWVPRSTRIIMSPFTRRLKSVPAHVAHRPRPPILRFLHLESVNNHGVVSSSLLYSRVPSLLIPRTHSSLPPSSSLLILRHVRLRPPLRFSPSAPSASTPFTRTHSLTLTHSLPASSRMFVSTERLSSAWRHTPMKWNPLPWFVGALLLVLIQYRRYRSEKEVYIDEEGHEVIKLKGPWQVGKCALFFSWPVLYRVMHPFHCTWRGFRPRRTLFPPNPRSTILIVP